MNDQTKPSPSAPPQAAVIANLWATLTQATENGEEADVFLLMFGPWSSDQDSES